MKFERAVYWYQVSQHQEQIRLHRNLLHLQVRLQSYQGQQEWHSNPTRCLPNMDYKEVEVLFYRVFLEELVGQKPGRGQF